MVTATQLETRAEALALTILGRETKWSIKGEYLHTTVTDAFQQAGFTAPPQPSPLTAAARTIDAGRVKKLLPKLVRHVGDRASGEWALIGEYPSTASASHHLPAGTTVLRLEHEHTIKVDAEGDRLTYSDGLPNTPELDALYHHFRVTTQAEDISQALKQIVRHDLQGSPLWRDGNDYFIAAPFAERALQLRTLIRALCAGTGTVFTANAVVDEPATRADTLEQVLAAITQDVQSAWEELRAISTDPKVRASTFQTRLAAYEQLRQKLLTTTRTFAVGAEELTQRLAKLDQIARLAVEARS